MNSTNEEKDYDDNKDLIQSSAGDSEIENEDFTKIEEFSTEENLNVLENVNLSICAGEENSDSEYSKENIASSFYKEEQWDCFQSEISLSDDLVEESEKWLHDIHTIERHRKELYITPETHLDEQEKLFTYVVSEFEDVIQMEEDVSKHIALIEVDLHLLDLEEDEDNSKIKILCFNALPNEIKLKIFSYFTRRELCSFVAPICLSWFQLAKDPLFWTSIYKSDFLDVQSDLLIDVIFSWCNHLSYLELDDRSDINVEGFLKIFQNCPRIKYLSVKLCKQIDDDILRLIPLHCKTLTSINLEGCSNLTDKSFYNFIALPLQCISVAYCNQISDEGGIFLVRNFSNLREVNFDGVQWMTDDFVKELVQKHYETLDKVVLDGENITDAALELLTTCKQLKVLGLSFCNSLSYRVIDFIARCVKLRELKLRKGTDFTNSSLLRYFQDMSEEQGNKFKTLNLAECTEITDECLFHLSEKCPNMEYLDLSWCWEVSDDGIAFVIDNCHKLKELHLVGLHELYGVPFSRVVKSNPKLTFLDLSQCNRIKDEIVSNLVNLMPKLVAKDYYGDTLVNHLNTHEI